MFAYGFLSVVLALGSLVVFWWLGAIAQLAQAAHAILSQTQRSYVQEKLATAIRHLRNGVSESAAVGYVLADPLMNWLSRFPLD